ncbi:MAG: hypothetical protein GF384_06480 [Elusimicrobia bacterium]|nr:hypothetical protein [Elusimicrobiota bacterium]MBD3412362.1 hypothetical protein [Elusimicrobiota bacterium]
MNMETPIHSTVSEDLKSFISHYVSSYAAWDIVTYFYDTPGTIRADVDEIASSIGREPSDIKPILEHLTAMGILFVVDQHTKHLYAPNNKSQVKDLIHKFLRFTATKQGRLKTIYLITSERFKKEE